MGAFAKCPKSSPRAGGRACGKNYGRISTSCDPCQHSAGRDAESVLPTDWLDTRGMLVVCLAT
ncbi:unnamed protein product [Symbiodinium sp. CCMP2456]|nr:unnamed protein product [Symbiodinium sp. CCMP2456]